MRKDRERSGGPTVEFIDDEPPASAGNDEVVLARRVRDRAVVAAGLLVAVLVLVAVGHTHSTPTPVARKPSRPVLQTSSVPPREPPLEDQFGTGTPGSPTAAIVKAFAAHLPGAVVISEHTSLTNRGRELDARRIRAVTGNVTLDIVISRQMGLLPSHVTRIVQGVYAVTIRSKGIYAPTKQQLDRLAADRRLTAVL